MLYDAILSTKMLTIKMSNNCLAAAVAVILTNFSAFSAVKLVENQRNQKKRQSVIRDNDKANLKFCNFPPKNLSTENVPVFEASS